MKINAIAIVVVAYNRLDPFCRLMKSIAQIKTTQKEIPLVISIDYHENNSQITEYAENYNWTFGQKEIIKYNDKIGLKQHIINCGNLTHKYGSIIILEDDLLVSPYFYDYAVKASNFYNKETSVAGISLYAYERAESSNVSFKPLYDRYDSFFIQFPSSWGQCWTKDQWEDFSTWLEKNSNESDINSSLPAFINKWPKTSWKKFFAAYLIEKNKYFVYPKIGLSTNFGEIGQHHINQLNIRQVDLLSNNLNFIFPNFNESISKYDVGFELKYQSLLELNPELIELPTFDIDFYCKKNHKLNDIILTTAKSKKVIHSFSGRLFPLINNLIFNINGNELVLTKYKHVKSESLNVNRTKFYSELKFLFREILRLIYHKLNLMKK